MVTIDERERLGFVFPLTSLSQYNPMRSFIHETSSIVKQRMRIAGPIRHCQPPENHGDVLLGTKNVHADGGKRNGRRARIHARCHQPPKKGHSP